MENDTLHPAAKEAIREYMLKLITVPTIIAFIFGFFFKEAIWQGAYNKATEQALVDLSKAKGTILETLSKTREAQSAFSKQTKESQAAISDAQQRADKAAEDARALQDELSSRADAVRQLQKKVRLAQEEWRARAIEAYELTQESDNLRSDIKNLRELAAALENKEAIVNDVLKQLKRDDAFRNSLRSDISNVRRKILTDVISRNIFVLGQVSCSDNPTVLRVPVEGTKTDQWLVFGINRNITSHTGSKSGDNAIFSFRTDIIPESGRRSWAVRYFAEINTASGSLRKGPDACGDGVEPVQIVAIRAYSGIQWLR